MMACNLHPVYQLQSGIGTSDGVHGKLIQLVIFVVVVLVNEKGHHIDLMGPDLIGHPLKIHHRLGPLHGRLQVTHRLQFHITLSIAAHACACSIQGT